MRQNSNCSPTQNEDSEFINGSDFIFCFEDISVTEVDKPYLQIETQPHEGPYRFRYESELKNENHGCIQGIQQQKGNKSYPKVSLKNFNLHSNVSIRCSLYQADNQNSPHCNSISQRIKNRRIESPIQLEVSTENNFTAIFKGLTVVKEKRKNIKEIMLQKLVDQKELQINQKLSLEEIQWLEQEAEKQFRKINLNKACLCFQAFVFNEIDEQFVEICDAVYSNPIRNKIKRRWVKDLRIKSIVPCQGSVDGGMQTVILCDSVDTNDFKIKFYQLDASGQKVSWESVATSNSNDVHKNAAIVFIPPAFHSFIIDPVEVLVQIVRTSDGSTSNSLQYVYTP